MLARKILKDAGHEGCFEWNQWHIAGQIYGPDIGEVVASMWEEHLGCKINRRLGEYRPGLRGMLLDQTTAGWTYLFEGGPIARPQRYACLHGGPTYQVIMPLYHASRSGRSLERYEAHFSILGSTGISATYDQLIYIKVESDGTRTFGSEGRFEVVEPTLLAFDKENQWLCVLGDRSKLQRTEIRNAMLGAVPDDGTKVTRQAILEAVEVKSIKAAAKTKNDELKGLAANGLLLKQGNSNTGYVFSKTGSSQFQTRGENSEQPEEVEPVEEEEPVWARF